MTDREALTDRLQEAILDLDSRQLMAEAQGYSSAEWRRWTAREIAEDLARQVARSEGPGLDAPSLDEGLLDRAFRIVDPHSPPVPLGVWRRVARSYAALAAQENPTPARSAPSLDEGLRARALQAAFAAMDGDLFWSHGSQCPLRYNVNLPDPCTCGVDVAQSALRAALAQEGETPT